MEVAGVRGGRRAGRGRGHLWVCQGGRAAHSPRCGSGFGYGGGHVSSNDPGVLTNKSFAIIKNPTGCQLISKVSGADSAFSLSLLVSCFTLKALLTLVNQKLSGYETISTMKCQDTKRVERESSIGISTKMVAFPESDQEDRGLDIIIKQIIVMVIENSLIFSTCWTNKRNQGVKKIIMKAAFFRFTESQ